MKVGLISDVHGNLPALEAVLGALACEGVEAVWNLGDYVGYGPWPEEVVSRLREVETESVVGNYDLKVLSFPLKKSRWRKTKDSEKYLAFRWAWEHLSEGSRSYLAGLPGERRLTVCGVEVLLVHGSVVSNDEHLRSDTPLLRLEELADQTDADVVFCGHSHESFDREGGGVRFVNPGSVGRPEGSDWWASYAVLDFAAEALAVSLRREEYDVSETVSAIRAAGLPENFVRVFEEGKNLAEVKGLSSEDVEGGDRGLSLELFWGSDREDSILREVFRLAEGCGYEREHTHQVTRLSLVLFDALSDFLGLGVKDRLLLECGGLLHDIGWLGGQSKHHKRALGLILGAEDLGLSEGDRLLVGLIARYHRKSLPRDGHKYYGSLGKKDKRLVDLLGGILRLADGLDRSHTSVVCGLSCEVSEGAVVVRCEVCGSAWAEQAVLGKKADLLERVLGRKILVEMVEG